MFGVTGKQTTIVSELEKLTGEVAIRISAPTWPGPLIEPFVIPACNRFVLAAGILLGKPIDKVSQNEALECCAVNLVTVIRLCEEILNSNPRARICVIGSASASLGSFDKLYAATKAGVAQYCQMRELGEQQQLVCIEPTIIIDSGMTRRRPDFEGLETRRFTVRAIDVARMVHAALWFAAPYHTAKRESRVIPVLERKPP